MSNAPRTLPQARPAGCKPYVPNEVPQRTAYAVLAVLLLAHGTCGVLVDDLFLPGKRGRGVHLHGMPAWMMYGAIAGACLVMLSTVLDHYDRRDNEARCLLFAQFAMGAAWAFVTLTLATLVFG